MNKKTNAYEVYEVYVKYGSDFQRKSWGKMLPSILEALSSQMGKTHNGNCLKFKKKKTLTP